MKKIIKQLLPNEIRQFIQPRKFQGFCAGAEKTGTTSLASILDDFRSAHEPHWTSTVEQMHCHFKGITDNRTFKKFLAARDKSLWLEFESSCLMGYCAPYLQSLFSHAKFVLTVRPCISWLKSVINHHKTHKRNDTSMNQWYEIAYQPSRYAYSSHDAILEKHDLFPAVCFMAYWARSLDWVTENINKENLLILRTDEINDSSSVLSEFLGVEKLENISTTSHKNIAEKNFGIFESLDKAYLEDLCEKICSTHMQRFFPKTL